MSAEKQRVLFVDDDPLVLSGLRRMLRVTRDEWEIEFFDSAPRALERMEEVPFDVVISDMQMPVMNGADFLNLVMLRHPNTLRIVLSGHADRELILQCTGSAHQYLAKPCDAKVLRATVTRATALQSTFHAKPLMAMVARIDELPSLPAIYNELVACLESPDVSMEKVGSIISRDIAMTAKVLKIVNSAFFGVARRVASPAEAASYLGADTLRSLVLLAHMYTHYEAKSPRRAFADNLWGHSLKTSAVAKALAAAEGLEKPRVADAAAAGLLHDIGKLVLDLKFPGEYPRVCAEAKASGRPAADIEDERLGVTHAQIGGYLLGLWGLPQPVVEAVTLHHSAKAALLDIHTVLATVFLADGLVQAAGSPSELQREQLAQFGLGGRLEGWKATAQGVLDSLQEKNGS